MFANATLLAPGEGRLPVTVDLSGATEEAGEPFFAGRCWWNPLNRPERSVWLKFIANHFGVFEIDTVPFITLEIVKGSELTNLAPVKRWSTGYSMAASMNKGEVFYFQLHDCSVEATRIKLSYSFKPFPVAQTITFSALPDVPFSSEPIVLQATTDSGLPVKFRVFEGNATLNGNILIPTLPGKITVAAEAPENEDYYSAWVSRTFIVTESAQSPPRPPNDEAVNAIDLGSELLVWPEGTTLGARHEAGEPWQTNALGAVWYKWSPAQSGGVEFRNELGDVNVFTFNRTFSPGFQISGNSNGFFAQAGHSYYLAVYAGATSGSFRFSAVISRPRNDDFADSLPLRESNGSVEVIGNFWGATKEPGEPSMNGAQGSTWYRWIPEHSGKLDYTYSPLGTGEIPTVWLFHAKADSFDKIEYVSAANGGYVLAGEAYYLAITKSLGPIRFLIQIAPFPPPGGESSVGKNSQSISFNPVGTISENLTLSANSSSGLPVRFEIASGPATLAGADLKFTGPGAVVVRALQDGDDFVEAAPPVAQILVLEKLKQTIEIVDERSAAPRAVLSDADSGALVTAMALSSSPKLIYLTARATSRLPVTVEVVSGAGHLVNNILVLDGNGPVVVRASQNGDDVYNPAIVEKVFAAGQRTQTIAFDPLPPVRVGIPPISLSASASSGLPVLFEVLTGPGTITGNVLTVSAPGSITIRASQPGDLSYTSARLVDQTLLIEKAVQTVSFNPPTHVFLPAAPMALSASATSGLPLSFALLSGAGQLLDGQLLLQEVGDVVIAAWQSGDSMYEAAPLIQRTIHVFERPRLAFAANAQGVLLTWPLDLPAVRIESARTITGPWLPVPTDRADGSIGIPPIEACGFFRLKID